MTQPSSTQRVVAAICCVGFFGCFLWSLLLVALDMRPTQWEVSLQIDCGSGPEYVYASTKNSCGYLHCVTVGGFECNHAAAVCFFVFPLLGFLCSFCLCVVENPKVGLLLLSPNLLASCICAFVLHQSFSAAGKLHTPLIVLIVLESLVLIAMGLLHHHLGLCVPRGGGGGGGGGGYTAIVVVVEE